MVRGDTQHQRQPIMRDFLGLGTLATTGDPGHYVDDGNCKEPDFWSRGPGVFVSGTPADQHCFVRSHVSPGVQPAGGLHTSVNMDFTGASHPLYRKAFPNDLNLALGKSFKEKYPEGAADSHGLAYARLPLAGSIGGHQTRGLALDVCPESCGAQLTIFYAGNVNVYDNIPAQKAQAIMEMAASGNSLPLNVLATSVPLGTSRVFQGQGLSRPSGVGEKLYFSNQIGQVPLVADQASQNCPPANVQFECATPSTPSSASSPEPMVPRALPLARKASLARFLEKRKERMRMMAPYLKQQLPNSQFLSPAGDAFMGLNRREAIAKMYEEYSKKRMSLLFGMQATIATHNETSPWAEFLQESELSAPLPPPMTF